MALIRPYRLRPVPPTVAVLTDDGLALDEHGELLELDRLPKGVRCYADWDTVQRLLEAGHGEAFCWDGEPIRWRHRDFGDEHWTRRHTDVSVIRLPFPEQGRALAGLTLWRDWLGSYGASPQGSLGSTGMSLLRASLRRELWTARGQLPPIRWTLGGRQELAVPQWTRAYGAEHFDLPAAYARTLGELRYGGVWRQVDAPSDPSFWAQAGRPVFAHATVRVPGSLRVGPLPRRPRKRPPSNWDALLLPVCYPVGTTLRGTWTLEELNEARDAGCTVAIDRLWVHLTETGDLGRPFEQWWANVQEGRALGGFAGLLAKASANALWGQFCISEGERTLVAYRKGRKVNLRLPAPGGGMPRSWDLAELVTGRVRAQLATAMRQAGERLLSAHTDGFWALPGGAEPDGWLVKDRAAMIELLGPQMLRYWRHGAEEPLYRVSGVPPSQAARTFEWFWNRPEERAS